jgi:hypothetical protein
MNSGPFMMNRYPIPWLIVFSILFLTYHVLKAQSPGVQIGTTLYEHQTNGSTGNRIAVCNDGSIYMSWQNLYESPSERHVHYAWFDPTGTEFETGRVDIGEDAGYTTLDIIYGNRAAIVYHSASQDDSTLVTLAIDHNYIHDFEIFDPPDTVYPVTPESPGACFWPYVAVSRFGNIHIVMTENPLVSRPQRIAYTRSENGGVFWTDPVVVDTGMVISSVIDVSPVSDRTVIGLCKSQDTTTQWKNDVVYYESDDGLTWDFENGMVNITDYGNDDQLLWAFTDMDIIYDYDDYIHAVWNAVLLDDDGIHYPTRLFHYSEQTGEITLVTSDPTTENWLNIGGSWNLPICKMNMGVYEITGGPDAVFVSWTNFDTSDVAANGYGNGELFMSYSIDNGLTWTEPQNLTNSHTPNCLPGDCESDNWSSLADIVDDSLHIMYINDKCPAASQRNEGVPTLNPVMYLAVPNPLITGIGTDEYALPKNLSLDQNYPNPFNESTTISFSIQQTGKVKLEIFDITGAFVQTLLDETLPAGEHHIAWNAADLASGTYLYKLTLSGKTTVRKAVLIK